MKKITLLMLPLLLVTMVSCGLKDTLWNENSDVSLNLEKNILQQVNRNVFADKKAEETDESKVVNFVCTISGDYSNTQTQPVDFANEVNTVSFTFENLPVGGIIDVEMVLILESTGDELYRGKTESVKVLSNNATKVQIRLSKASEKLKDLFYPKKNVKICDWNDDWIDTGDSQNEIQNFYKEKVQGDGQLLDWCFDENGEVIYLYRSGNERIVSRDDNLITNGIGIENLWEYSSVEQIAYDKLTKFIYCWGSSYESYIIYVFDSQNPTNAYSGELLKAEVGESYKITSIAAHNGILYVAYQHSYIEGEKHIGKHKIDEYSIPKDLSTINGSLDLNTPVKSVTLTSSDSGLKISENDFASWYTITDMEIQGGSLIALFSVYNLNDICTGGIARFNLENLELEEINKQNSFGAKINKDSISKELKGYCLNEGYYLGETLYHSAEYKSLFLDGKAWKEKITVDLYFVNSKKDSEAFLGPQRFFAIKPKKLILLDKGFFLYEDEEKLSKKTRFMTVDLENYVLSVGEDTDLFESISIPLPSTSNNNCCISKYTNIKEIRGNDTSLELVDSDDNSCTINSNDIITASFLFECNN